MNWLNEIIDWSEVWVLLIPLTVFFIKRPKAPWINPVLLYLLISLICNVIVDVTWKSKSLGLEEWCKKIFWWLYVGEKEELYNTIFYNLNSVARLLLFTWFFFIINKNYKTLYKVTWICFVLFFTINFIYLENIRDFSSRQLSAEAGIMLFYCLLYFYQVNTDDEIPSVTAIPYFWIVTGLTLYTAINFMIFLFFRYLITEEYEFSLNIWTVHNISYIILNLFIAISFWKAKQQRSK